MAIENKPVTSEFKDLEKTCSVCNKPFIFTAGEQQFFASKQFVPPKKCKECRAAAKAEKEARENGGGGGSVQDVWRDTPPAPSEDDRGNRRDSRGGNRGGGARDRGGRY